MKYTMVQMNWMAVTTRHPQRMAGNRGFPDHMRTMLRQAPHSMRATNPNRMAELKMIRAMDGMLRK